MRKLSCQEIYAPRFLINNFFSTALTVRYSPIHASVSNALIKPIIKDIISKNNIQMEVLVIVEMIKNGKYKAHVQIIKIKIF